VSVAVADTEGFAVSDGMSADAWSRGAGATGLAWAGDDDCAGFLGTGLAGAGAGEEIMETISGATAAVGADVFTSGTSTMARRRWAKRARPKSRRIATW
jgi:hypothetical protein